MKPDVICPHCEQPLGALILRKLWASYCNTLRKTRGGGGSHPRKQVILDAVQDPEMKLEAI